MRTGDRGADREGGSPEPGAPARQRQDEPQQDLGLLASTLREYAIFTLDTAGNVTSWNPGAERIKGYRPDEIIGRNFSVFFTPEQIVAGHPHRTLVEAAEYGSHIDEDWCVRKDGSQFPAHSVITSLRDDDGRLRGYAQVTRDETEPRARLERSVRQFADLFEITPVGIGLFDTSGQLVGANSALCGLLGYEQHELRAMTVADLIHPDDRAGPLLPEAPDSPAHHDSVQRTLVRADGEPVYCEPRIAQSVRESGGYFWLVVFQDVTERHRQAEELRYRATHDDLTGLPNRAAVEELLDDLDPTHVAMLYCDLDRFKRINDSLGHKAGDELLVILARRLEAKLPQGWSVARMPGDEFLIICPDVPAAGGIEAVSTTVSDVLRVTVPLRGQYIRVSASVGVAIPGSTDTSSDDLVRFSSAAALDAKSGHERISLAGPALIGSVDRQLQMEEQLREAVENDALSLHYQPIVTSDGTIVAAEALVRWQHPSQGMLSPGTFLPVAERGSLLRDLDCWVLRTALREAAGWSSPTGEPVDIGVNLMSLVPGDPDFVKTVTGFVADSGIAWQRVVLELVESSLVELPSRLRLAMNELHERGARFAVDDFGTGYSSLSRLKELPAQIVKADRRFVSDMDSDPSDYALVRAVSDMAHAMGSSCTAEGVETCSQFELLRELGVNTYQGWLFSAAVPAEDFRALLSKGRLDPG